MDQLTPGGFEFNWGPSLWGAATMIVGGIVVLVGLGRPSWILPVTIFAGLVAGIRSEYYEHSGNNALMAVFLALPIVMVVHGTVMALVNPEVDVMGDVVFYTGYYTLGWVLLVGLVLLPLAYLGAILGDSIRKRYERRSGDDPEESTVGQILEKGQSK